MNEKVLFTVMKKDKLAQSHIKFIPAKLAGFRRTKVVNVKYPAATYTGKTEDSVEGILITNLTPNDIKFLDWFEGSEYERVVVSVEISDGQQEKAHVYRWSDPVEKLVQEDWDDTWLSDSTAVDHWLKYEIESLENCPTF